MSYFAGGFTKDKIIVMHALRVLEIAPTKDQINAFFARFDIMPYFEMQSAVCELEEDGFIAAVPRPYGQAYCLSQKGRDTLAMFEERVPQSQRDRIKECADEYKSELIKQTQYSSAVERTGGGAYRVTLRAMERNGELIRVEVLLPDEESAKRAASIWPEKAQAIYTAVLRELG